MRVVGLTTTMPAGAMQGAAPDRIAPTIAQVDVAHLTGLRWNGQGAVAAPAEV
jgi:hypothetical protein